MNNVILLIIGSAAIAIAGCKPLNKGDAEYREQSTSQTTEATKEVFSGNQGAATQDTTAIEALFRRFSDATRSTDPINVEDFLTVRGMIQSMDSMGLLENLNLLERTQFKRGLNQGIQNFGTSMRQMAFDDFRILRVETIDEDETLVYLRQYDNNLNITMQMRWWLLQTDEGLRIYDFEELSAGLRTMNLIGTLIKASISGQPEPWVADMVAASRVMQSIDMSDPESILLLAPALTKLRTHQLPTDIRRFASMLHTSVLQVKGEFEASLAELTAAKEGGYDAPIHHYLMATTLSGLGEHIAAIDELNAHAAILGWDSDVYELLSDEYWQLGRYRDAREAALKGLADNPNSINCLASLSIASTEEELLSEEARLAFADCSQPELAYEVSLDYLLISEETAKAKTLFSIFRKAYPSSDLIEYYEEQIQ